MDIPQIISPDGYIHRIFDRDQETDKAAAEFVFPRVSDYITGALAEGKPYFFSGRSGNAQMGILTDSPCEGAPEVEGSKVLLRGIIQNLNPMIPNALDLFETGDEIGRLVVMDPEMRIADVRHYLHKRLFVGDLRGKGYYDGFEIRRETDPATGREADYISVALAPYQYRFEPAAPEPIQP